MSKDSPTKHQHSNDPAINLIRSRIDALYDEDEEPSAKEELAEVKTSEKPLSKHQQYMKDLSESGDSLANIQIKWHEYYQALPDNQKHEVWQEFYANHSKSKLPENPQNTPVPEMPVVINTDQPANQKTKHFHHKESLADTKSKITNKIHHRKTTKLSAKDHFKSLLFGLSLSSVLAILLLFSFFNERFIAPFITPSRNVSSTPVIIDPNTTTAGPNPTIIIPKINVEVPVVYDVPSIQEKDIQSGLEGGVVHYITTPNPGEQGNSVIVGHSSNNILNKGKYKFAFVLLNKLDNGDTFSLTKNSKRYTYKIYEKKIVKPTDLSVLGSQAKPATVTLITCDPPGTSINRLIIVGEQISPDVSTNVASTAKPDEGQPTIVPGNAPSLWSRFTNLFSS